MSDAVPVSIPVSLVPPTLTSGNTLPPGGRDVSALRANARGSVKPATPNATGSPTVTGKSAATGKPTVDEVVQQLNKYLNDSGRANTFRVDPDSRNQTIQEINPSTGEVIGEFAVQQFPALVRSLGVSGVLVDRHV